MISHTVASVTCSLIMGAVIVMAYGATVPMWLPVAVIAGVAYLTLTQAHS